MSATAPRNDRLPGGGQRPYRKAMSSVNLPPDLERIAAGAVASGRYRDVGEVLDAALHLLQRQEEARAAFVASLEEAEAESERDGFCTLDEVDTELRSIVEAERRAKTAP